MSSGVAEALLALLADTATIAVLVLSIMVAFFWTLGRHLRGLVRDCRRMEADAREAAASLRLIKRQLRDLAVRRAGPGGRVA